MKELRLTKIPKDVFDIVLKKQLQIKLQKGTNQYSFESTLYNIVREWQRCIAEKETAA